MSKDSKDTEVEEDVSSEVQFEGAVPKSMNVNITVKLTTRQYESATYGSSISMDFLPGADIEKVYSQAYQFLSQVLKPKVAEIRRRYSRGGK